MGDHEQCGHSSSETWAVPAITGESGVPEPPLSHHPIDILIRQIAAGEQGAREGDIERIIERIASAPFEPRGVTVPPDWRGLFYLGHEMTEYEPSLTFHLFARVVVNRQWAFGTTAERYLSDLRAAVRSAPARIAVYHRRGGTIVAIIADTKRVIDSSDLGAGSDLLLVVIYSADRGIIVTGYQASGLETVALPEDVLWLR